MKTLRWNIGIILIRFGYYLKNDFKNPHSIRCKLSIPILKYAYKLRGQIPMKTWKGVHI